MARSYFGRPCSEPFFFCGVWQKDTRVAHPPGGPSDCVSGKTEPGQRFWRLNYWPPSRTHVVLLLQSIRFPSGLTFASNVALAQIIVNVYGPVKRPFA